jgi:GNAT superfamily N-acetyltransferase
VKFEIGFLANHVAFVPEVARWFHAEWSHLRPGDSVEAWAESLKRSLRTGGVQSHFVAFDHSVYLGSALLVRHDLPERSQLEPWLAGLFVVPSARRQGIGTALVNRVAGEARQVGVQRLYLATLHPAFFERLGWQALERVEHLGEMNVVMELRLPA